MDSQSPAKIDNRSPARTPTKRNRNQNTLTEKAFKYFKRITFEEKLSDLSNKKTHICNVCHTHLNGSKESNLAGHLEKSHPNIYAEFVGERDSIAVQRLKLLQQLVEIVTINGRSFSHLTDSGFKSIIAEKLQRLSTAGCPLNLGDSNLPEIKQHLHKTAEKIKEKIKNEAKNRSLSLIVDLGTARNRSICSFTIQYTLDGERKIRSVGMKELLQAHTGLYIAEVIEKRLLEFGITFEQIISITTDNRPRASK